MLQKAEVFMPKKEISQLNILSRLRKGKDTGKFSHPTFLAKKKQPKADMINPPSTPAKYQNLWFLKIGDDNNIVLTEVLAGEYFRYIIPSHPKTRLVMDATDQAYVLSKEVQGYRSLETIDQNELKTKIASGEYYGLGEILVTSLVMNEIDLKPSNIGIDKTGRIIKIDGDWCFARLRESFYDKNFSITESDLNQLPFVTDYYAYNLLDLISEGVRNPTSVMVDHDLSNNKLFRKEINEAILKNIIQPYEMVEIFVKNYIEPEESALYLATEIFSRLENLTSAALQNESFKEYLQSTAAKKYLNDHIKYLNNFKTTHNNLLLGSNNTIIDAMYHNYDVMLKTIKKENPTGNANNLSEIISNLSMKVKDNFQKAADFLSFRFKKVTQATKTEVDTAKQTPIQADNLLTQPQPVDDAIKNSIQGLNPSTSRQKNASLQHSDGSKQKVVSAESSSSIIQESTLIKPRMH
jgi:hypothetical protein